MSITTEPTINNLASIIALEAQPFSTRHWDNYKRQYVYRPCLKAADQTIEIPYQASEPTPRKACLAAEAYKDEVLRALSGKLHA